MNIRLFKPEDAHACSEIIEECFLNQNLGDFSKNIINNQIKDNSPEKLLEYLKDTKYFVAVKNNNIIGLGGYNKIKVRTLFVDMKYQNRGIGHKLLLTILEDARKNGLKKLFCWSTFFAESFYKKHGFIEKGETFFEADIEHKLMISE